MLTPCHGATLHCVPSCTIQGHVSLYPHGWDAPSSHGREDFATHAPLPKCDETRVSCVDCGSRTRSLHLLYATSFCLSSLQAWHAVAQSLRRWGFLSIPTPELPASASGIGMGRLTCSAGLRPVPQHATHPRGRHSSHTQDLLRLCTSAPVMPCPRCSEVAPINVRAAMAVA